MRYTCSGLEIGTSTVVVLANDESLLDGKIQNTEKLLAWILVRQCISRVEIAELCSLAPSTVGQASASLTDDGLVVEYPSGVLTGQNDTLE